MKQPIPRPTEVGTRHDWEVFHCYCGSSSHAKLYAGGRAHLQAIQQVPSTRPFISPCLLPIKALPSVGGIARRFHTITLENTLKGPYSVLGASWHGEMVPSALLGPLRAMSMESAGPDVAIIQVSHQHTLVWICLCLSWPNRK